MVAGDPAEADFAGPTSQTRTSRRTWDRKEKAAEKLLERDMAARAILAAKTARS